MKMEKSTIDKLSSHILWSASILSASIIYSSFNISSEVGRYTLTPERQDWVLIGDTRTGRSWSCMNEVLYKEGLKDGTEMPEGFDGCYEMSTPEMVQNVSSNSGNL
jgi:hypothetical protein